MLAQRYTPVVSWHGDIQTFPINSSFFILLASRFSRKLSNRFRAGSGVVSNNFSGFSSSSISSSTSISIYVPTIQASSTASGVSQSPFSSPNLNRNKSQIVRIVVGIIGAATLVAVIFWYFRRRRRRAGEQPSPLVDDGARMAEAAGQLDPGPLMPIRYYVRALTCWGN